jgi:hypothetical protein
VAACWAGQPSSDYSRAPTQDGVVVLYSSVPGGGAAPYDEGDTGTHEIGHWLGLYHTFQGLHRFGRPGQRHAVRSARPPTAAPPGDSCRRKTSADPITNFMDYTDDACMNQFTAGQVARMDQMHLQYRSN